MGRRRMALILAGLLLITNSACAAEIGPESGFAVHAVSEEVSGAADVFADEADALTNKAEGAIALFVDETAAGNELMNGSSVLVDGFADEAASVTDGFSGADALEGELPDGLLAGEETSEEMFSGEELAREELAGEGPAGEAFIGDVLTGDGLTGDVLSGEESFSEMPSEEDVLWQDDLTEEISWEDASGVDTPGEDALEESAFGEDSLGESAFGENSLGEDALGERTLEDASSNALIDGFVVEDEYLDEDADTAEPLWEEGDVLPEGAEDTGFEVSSVTGSEVSSDAGSDASSDMSSDSLTDPLSESLSEDPLDGSFYDAEEVLYVEETADGAAVEAFAGQDGIYSGTGGAASFLLEDPDGTSNEDLFADYVDAILGSNSGLSGGKMLKAANRSGGTLTGQDAVIYRRLKQMAAAIADGSETSTVVSIGLDELGIDTDREWTAKELGVDAIVKDEKISEAAMNALIEKTVNFRLRNITLRLLAECPYEMFWFDKTIPIDQTNLEFGAGTDKNGELRLYFKKIPIVFSVPVAAEFADGTYKVKASVAVSVNAAKTNIEAILSRYADKSDYEKLAGYKNEICSLVSYNEAAMNPENHTPYGSPWQLIWVFDGDPSTNVVCEGYSKAFQYLCERTEFLYNTVSCYHVTGKMDGGTGAGASHMWNIVHMYDGRNYLVDVTNCDEDTIGHPDYLFLAGYSSGDVLDKYIFKCAGDDTISFSYDLDTRSINSEEELTIASRVFDPNHVECAVHTWDVGTTLKENSCTEAGSAHYVCEVCGAERDEVVPAAGHTTVVDAAVPASCMEPGKTEGSHCSVCGKIHVAQETVPAAGHTTAIDAAVPATCTEPGKTEGSHCLVCGEIFTAQKTVPATGHRWNAGKVTKEPTARAEGVKTFTCTVCKAARTEPVAKLSAEEARKKAEGDPSDPTSVAGVEKAMTAVRDSGEPKGSSFSLIRLQSAKQSKNSITLKWNKVAGADGYLVYGNRCGSKYKLARIAKQSNTSFVYQKLKKGTYYKFTVSAYKSTDGREQVIGSSRMIHVATTGGKVTNVKKVTAMVKKKTVKKVSLKTKKTTTIKGKETVQNKKLKLKRHRVLKYESSNPKIATVSAKGKVKAKKKGKCFIYVYSQSGVFARVTVTVK